MRKDQAIQDLQAENEALQNILEEMSTTFLGFGDRMWSLGLLSEEKDLAREWRGTLAKMLDLAERAQSMPMEGKSDLSEPPFLAEPLAPEGASTWSSTPIVSPPQTSTMAPIQVQEAITSPLYESTSNQNTEVPLRLVRMLTLNPLMADDYLDLESTNRTNMTFSERLLREGLLRAYRCLELQRWGHEDRSLSAWTARVFKYSFVDASAAKLLAIIKRRLRSLVTEGESVSNTEPETPLIEKRRRLALHYLTNDTTAGTLARQRMTEEGVAWAGMLDAEEVEDYLMRSGFVYVGQREAQLPITPAVLPRFAGPLSFELRQAIDQSVMDGETAVAIIDVEMLISKILETSLCLDDSVGYWRGAVDEAILSSTVRVE